MVLSIFLESCGITDIIITSHSLGMVVLQGGVQHSVLAEYFVFKKDEPFQRRKVQMGTESLDGLRRPQLCPLVGVWLSYEAWAEFQPM